MSKGTESATREMAHDDARIEDDEPSDEKMEIPLLRAKYGVWQLHY